MERASSLTQRERSWTFLTNHAVVLLLIEATPTARIETLRQAAGLSTRSTQMIVADLCHAGYVHRTRIGRRNHYTIDPSLPLRHHALRDHATAAALLNHIHTHPAA